MTVARTDGMLGDFQGEDHKHLMGKTKGKARAEPRRSWMRRLPWFRMLLVLGLVLSAWLIYLDAQIRERFEGKRWQLPAQVYAQPFELLVGQNLSPGELTDRLKMQGYRAVERASQPGLFQRQGNEIRVFLKSFEFPEGLRRAGLARIRFAGSEIHEILFDGQSSAWLQLDPLHIGGIYPASGEDRILVSLTQVPKPLVEALLLTEDRDFYSHWGISLSGIARALFANIRSGKVVQGGSTLTQQLVKNLFLHEGRTLTRKINEAFMALLLEWHFEKDEILEAYLNEVYLGQAGARAIHGFGQGSRFYFDKPIDDLTLAEAALLVGLVKGASWYDPRRHPQRAKDRRNLVLKQMREAGVIGDKAFAAAQSRPLSVVAKGSLSADRYPGFLQLVKQELLESYPIEDLQSEGLRIFTTLEPGAQALAQSALESRLKQLQQGRSVSLQGALMLVAHETGEVVALVPGKVSSAPGFNRALEARRPIGSLIKPVTLAALFKETDVSLVSPLSDRGFRLTFEDGQVWEPKNYDGEEHGDVTVLEALTHSYNLAFARAGLDLGVPKVLSLLQELGMSRLPPAYPSVLLGSLDLTPLEMTQVYQNLINGGFELRLRSIRQVVAADGKLLKAFPYRTRQLLSPANAYLVQFAMQNVMREGTGKSAYQRLPQSVSLGGKTGTTNEGRDSWFSGFNGQYLGTVWIGNDDNQPTGLTGASGALSIWTDLFSQLPPVGWQTVQPDEVVWYRTDLENGVRFPDSCSQGRPVPYRRGTEPSAEGTCGAGEQVIRSMRAWWQSLFDE